MSKVYTGEVSIETIKRPQGRTPGMAVKNYFASITPAGSHKPVYVGPNRRTEESAIRDAASWLEGNDFVHPTTHDIV